MMGRIYANADRTVIWPGQKARTRCWRSRLRTIHEHACEASGLSRLCRSCGKARIFYTRPRYLYTLALPPRWALCESSSVAVVEDLDH